MITPSAACVIIFSLFLLPTTRPCCSSSLFLLCNVDVLSLLLRSVSARFGKKDIMLLHAGRSMLTRKLTMPYVCRKYVHHPHSKPQAASSQTMYGVCADARSSGTWPTIASWRSAVRMTLPVRPHLRTFMSPRFPILLVHNFLPSISLHRRTWPLKSRLTRFGKQAAK